MRKWAYIFFAILMAGCVVTNIYNAVAGPHGRWWAFVICIPLALCSAFMFFFFVDCAVWEHRTEKANLRG